MSEIITLQVKKSAKNKEGSTRTTQNYTKRVFFFFKLFYDFDKAFWVANKIQSQLTRYCIWIGAIPNMNTDWAMPGLKAA